MADLRTRFIEDYAGGLLNIARQELSSTGEVLAQDGFVEGTSLFVEDGRGVKSGLRLGSSLAECIDPTTETGVLNVRSADRTYAKIRDLKIFATAVASAQGALSESVAESFTNLEGAFESLESDVELFRNRLDNLSDIQVTLADGDRGDISITDSGSTWTIDNSAVTYQKIQDASANNIILGRYDIGSGNIQEITIGSGLSITSGQLNVDGGEGSLSTRQTFTGSTSASHADGANELISISGYKSYVLLKASVSEPAWVRLYCDNASRTEDASRPITEDPSPGSGVIAEFITTSSTETVLLTPGIFGFNNDQPLGSDIYLSVQNRSEITQAIEVTLTLVQLEA